MLGKLTAIACYSVCENNLVCCNILRVVRLCDGIWSKWSGKRENYLPLEMIGLRFTSDLVNELSVDLSIISPPTRCRISYVCPALNPYYIYHQPQSRNGSVHR